MKLFKENKEIQNNVVRIVSFQTIEILKIKQLKSLHNKHFAKNFFEKKSRSSFR